MRYVALLPILFAACVASDDTSDVGQEVAGTPDELALTITDAIARGLRSNLGAILGGTGVEAALVEPFGPPEVPKELTAEIDGWYTRGDVTLNAQVSYGQQDDAAVTADATTGAARSFFELPAEGLRSVFDLNLIGTILPCQVFGRLMADRAEGVILNISSMNAFRPLTRIPAYSAAKAGVSNFTQWLAVYMAQEYSTAIRVNALAPGFFLTEQNRFLLTEKESGALTRRGNQILDHTPMARFGSPADLVGPMLWLLSAASAFVTGIVVPIDGGFSAYSGV